MCTFCFILTEECLQCRFQKAELLDQRIYLCVDLLDIASSVQSLSCVQLFVTCWTAACQGSLTITNSWSLLKLMSIRKRLNLF